MLLDVPQINQITGSDAMAVVKSYDGYTCPHGITAKSNVVIDVSACGYPGPRHYDHDDQPSAAHRAGVCARRPAADSSPNVIQADVTQLVTPFTTAADATALLRRRTPERQQLPIDRLVARIPQ